MDNRVAEVLRAMQAARSGLGSAPQHPGTEAGTTQAFQDMSRMQNYQGNTQQQQQLPELAQLTGYNDIQPASSVLMGPGHIAQPPTLAMSGRPLVGQMPLGFDPGMDGNGRQLLQRSSSQLSLPIHMGQYSSAPELPRLSQPLGSVHEHQRQQFQLRPANLGPPLPLQEDESLASYRSRQRALLLQQQQQQQQVSQQVPAQWQPQLQQQQHDGHFSPWQPQQQQQPQLQAPLQHGPAGASNDALFKDVPLMAQRQGMQQHARQQEQQQQQGVPQQQQGVPPPQQAMPQQQGMQQQQGMPLPQQQAMPLQQQQQAMPLQQQQQAMPQQRLAGLAGSSLYAPQQPQPGRAAPPLNGQAPPGAGVPLMPGAGAHMLHATMAAPVRMGGGGGGQYLYGRLQQPGMPGPGGQPTAAGGAPMMARAALPQAVGSGSVVDDAPVDLTGDSDGEGEGAGPGQKRKLPVSFMAGPGTAGMPPKRPSAPNMAAPGQPNAGSLTPGTHAMLGLSPGTLRLDGATSQQQPGQPMHPQALLQRMMKVQQQLSAVRARLSAGSLPVERGSSVMRPMTEGERQRLLQAQAQLEAMYREVNHMRMQYAMQANMQQQQGVPGQSGPGWQGAGRPPALMSTMRGPAAPGWPTGSGRMVVPAPSPVKERENKLSEHQAALRVVIESLQVTGQEELEPPPKSLNISILRHQRMALAWMVRRETGGAPRGGILADDQGLGKTVTTISLILTHQATDQTNADQRNAAGAPAPAAATAAGAAPRANGSSASPPGAAPSPAATGGASASAGGGNGNGAPSTDESPSPAHVAALMAERDALDATLADDAAAAAEDMVLNERVLPPRSANASSCGLAAGSNGAEGGGEDDGDGGLAFGEADDLGDDGGGSGGLLDMSMGMPMDLALMDGLLTDEDLLNAVEQVGSLRDLDLDDVELDEELRAAMEAVGAPVSELGLASSGGQGQMQGADPGGGGGGGGQEGAEGMVHHAPEAAAAGVGKLEDGAEAGAAGVGIKMEGGAEVGAAGAVSSPEEQLLPAVLEYVDAAAAAGGAEVHGGGADACALTPPLPQQPAVGGDAIDLISPPRWGGEHAAGRPAAAGSADCIELLDDDSPAPMGAGAGAGAPPQPRAAAASDEPEILAVREVRPAGATASAAAGPLSNFELIAAAAAQVAPPPEPEPPSLLPGGSLVVCPTSVLHQWAREIRDKVSPLAGVTLHVYHGKDKLTSARQLAAVCVVLTTYGTLAQEAPVRERQAVKLGKQGTSNAPIDLADDEEEAPAGGGGGGAPGGGKEGKGKGGPGRGKGRAVAAEGGPLYSIKWQRVVLDEAQSIKNPRTLAAHAAWGLYAHCRWCLSGTPIQNGIDDLYSYFKFLRYAPYNDARTFKTLIKEKIAERPEMGYKFLQVVLQAVLLRRTKQSTINGEPIIRLPGREQALSQQRFSKAEQEFYTKVQQDSVRVLRETLAAGGGGQQYVNMLHVLLRLRQACNHPWLVQGGRKWHKTAAPTTAEIGAAKKLSADTRAQLLALVSGDGAQCPCCGDVPEDPVAATCGHVFCQQCAATQRDSAGLEGEFLCPACSRVLRPVDLHSGAALAYAQGGPPAPDAAGDAAGGEQPWVSSAKVDRLMALLEEVRTKNRDANKAATRPVAPSTVLATKSRSDAKLVGALRRLPPVGSGAGSSSGGAGPSDGGGPAFAGPKPDKVIVFSQWTSMLDLLEIPLKRAKLQFRRLDGTMTVPARERAIGDFETKHDVLVLLVSLKAAALGVNLTVANHVVLMDLWWNPSTEEQAIDRAHRIGQTRTVHVTRITVAGSVEDKILQLQQRKREIIAAALAEGRDGGASAGRLTMEDLRFLFDGLA